jgi:hypothetical protein
MKITIKADKKISEFQNEFTCFFPFLKAEFFTRPHDEGGASWSKYMYFNRTKTLGEIGKVENESDFEFTPQMTVGTFEQALWSQYGLAVQVFRKSMSSFIESTSSDSWTLEEQNKKGDEATHNIMEMVYEQRTNED